ncbi:alpha/beta fold hydrolase [Corynebacterium lipophiloflavum]|uniref:Hydrolase, alpha/beta domain protein n=1 Tax=Corynebacterium lipophiloflavum (strain ATCC 700352 / DSM 44291 / CCUG 37336 / JCM 10383 / DMMZ 1944) TaxID=525263 RepID=C0XRK4_CORLD|nr:alpha/beta fold hydrolase [Corynebacterium lipophiloflavum]EEI17136.1 hydrolase, alpha/beta domain protein [Corynebacterium lipophiloflavum DSM 44291]
MKIERDGFTIFARVLGDAPKPALLYLQGGPGFPSPREHYDWIATALEHYRVVLLDQRGTGRSTRIDRATPQLIDAPTLTRLRADAIVADAEAIRRELGVERWDVLGQSFGGFCLAHYLAAHPESVRHAFFTGGLPTVTRGVDEVYHATFAKLRARHQLFYREVPWAESMVREVCRHLDNSVESLPTGERLSSRRFRTVGVALGREGGLSTLAHLLEEPFHPGGRLRTDFLADVGDLVSFERAPLYAAVHESIYGGTVPGATAWAAQRVSESLDGFAPQASPDDAEFYLTGEHIFPFQFDEDPALRPFKEAADELAGNDDWPHLYAGLGASESAAAMVYTDDIFVPRELSLETADIIGAKVHETAAWQHDGLRRHGRDVVGVLMSAVGL